MILAPSNSRAHHLTRIKLIVTASVGFMRVKRCDLELLSARNTKGALHCLTILTGYIASFSCVIVKGKGRIHAIALLKP